MLPSRDQRADIERADQSVLEPFRELVTEALIRLELSGYALDGPEPAQAHVFLKASRERRIYRVRTVFFEGISDEMTGLFIAGIQRDDDGKALSRLQEIQIPRSPAAVSVEALFSKRGIPAEEVQRLSREITNASVIDETIWDDAEKQLLRNRYRE